MILHIWALHIPGSNNPTGVDVKGDEGHAAVPPVLHGQGRLRPGASSCSSTPASCSSRRTIWATRTTTFRPTRWRRRRTSCPNGISGRSTRSCAPIPGQAVGRAGDVRLDRCCSSCPGSTPRRCARATFRPIYKCFFWLLVVDVHRARLRRRRRSAGRLVVPLGQRRARSIISSTSSILLPVLGKIERPSAIAAQHRRRGAQEEGGLRTMRRDRSFPARLALAALAAGAVAIAAEPSPHPRPSSSRRIALALRGPVRHLRPRRRPARLSRSTRRSARPAIRCQLLAYRNLMELGLTENQVKGLIEDIQVPDLGDDGQPIERPARLSDRFKKPFPNEPPPRPPPTTARRRPTSASSSRRARAGRTTSMRC